MNKRIKDKIKEINNYLSELSVITPSDLEQYKNDFKTKAACERYFEKIIEAVVDLAYLILKDENLSLPEEDKQAFDILVKNEIINFELAERLKSAKGMRNLISHQYGNVDDEIIFYSITEELEEDVNKFLEVIRKLK